MEVEIYISGKTERMDIGKYSTLCQNISNISGSMSFPNLRKISIINNGSPYQIHIDSFLHAKNAKSCGRMPKLDHIITKGVNINPDSFARAQVMATQEKIKLDIN